MTQKKKVLYVTRALTPPWDEASKNFAHDIARYSSSENKLTVMTHGHVDDIPEHVHQADIYSPAAPSTFSTKQKLEALWYQWRTRKKFDVVHYFFTPAKLNSFIIKNFFRNKQTKTIQTVATLREDLLSADDFKKILFADKLVTYTKFAQHNLECMGFTNVSHAYPGIDLDHFREDIKDPMILQRFTIAPESTVVMYHGEYVRLGATDMIVNAMIKFWQQNSLGARNTILVLGLRVKNDGDAKKKAEVQKKFEKAGFGDRVRYTDTFADMRGLYNISDIVLFPVSNMRGKFDVPLALIETYACSKPVIVSDLARLKEFTDPSFSVIIEKDQTEQLTQAVSALVHDPERRAALGKAAREFTEKHFDIHTTVEHYERLYREI